MHFFSFCENNKRLKALRSFLYALQYASLVAASLQYCLFCIEQILAESQQLRFFGHYRAGDEIQNQRQGIMAVNFVSNLDTVKHTTFLGLNEKSYIYSPQSWDSNCQNSRGRSQMKTRSEAYLRLCQTRWNVFAKIVNTF